MIVPASVRNPRRGLGLWLTCVGPVGNLIAVDPDGDMGPLGDDSLVKPLAIVSDHSSRVDAPEDPPCATIDRDSAVVIDISIVDLTLVSIHRLTRNAPKKDAGVQLIAVYATGQLQDKVAESTSCLELPAAIFHMKLASTLNRKVACHFWIRLPTLQVFAIEEIA